MYLLYRAYISTILYIYRALVGGMLTYIVGVNKEEKKSK
jgi:hypothetical protein